MVSPGCGLDSAVGVAERIRTAIFAGPVNTADGMIQVTMSLGVTSYQPLSGMTAEDLLRAADEALYRAKDGGRNRVEASSSKGRDQSAFG